MSFCVIAGIVSFFSSNGCAIDVPAIVHILLILFSRRIDTAEWDLYFYFIFIFTYDRHDRMNFSKIEDFASKTHTTKSSKPKKSKGISLAKTNMLKLNLTDPWDLLALDERISGIRRPSRVGRRWTDQRISEGLARNRRASHAHFCFDIVACGRPGDAGEIRTLKTGTLSRKRKYFVFIFFTRKRTGFPCP